MGLKDIGYVTSRWNDFGGGLNLRMSSDSIDNKQNIISVNMVSEGNKLITIPGYVDYVTQGSGVTKGQAIALYSNYVLEIHNRNLYVFDTVTSTSYSKSNAVANSVDTYQIITTKSFSGNISIICINSNNSTTENIVGYEFNTSTHTFTAITFTGISDANFKTGAFYDGKLFLGGNPTFPSSLYFSKTGSVAAPTNLYDFSGYSSNAQNIGDGEAIVSIISNNGSFFIVKTNSIFESTGISDTGADAVSKSLAYIFRQVSHTGALNQFCILPVEQDILYFDGINIRRISYEMNMLNLSDDSISKDIEPVFKALPLNQSANTTMFYSYPFVKLFLRDKFSVSNSIGILYNVIDKSFSIQTGIDVVQGVGGYINNRRNSYFVSAQTSTIFRDGIGASYNGGNISASHKSKRWVLGDGVDFKRVSQVELYGVITPGLTGYIDIYVDGVIIDTRSIYYSEVLLQTTGTSPTGDTMFGSNSEGENSIDRAFVVRYEYFNDGRDFSFGIRSNGKGKFSLHGLNLMYKSIKSYPLHY